MGAFLSHIQKAVPQKALKKRASVNKAEACINFEMPQYGVQFAALLPALLPPQAALLLHLNPLYYGGLEIGIEAECPGMTSGKARSKTQVCFELCALWDVTASRVTAFIIAWAFNKPSPCAHSSCKVHLGSI